MENLILESLSDSVALLKICRPKALNALNRVTLQALLQFFHERAVDPSFRVLIITGEGDKSFIAGADIKEMQQMKPLEMLQFCALGQAVTQAFSQAPFPIIAAVNGYALGGGLEIALAADFIYASPKIRFGLPEVTLGLIPGFGGTQRLWRCVGARLAKELTLTGRLFSAEEGLSMGLINRICPAESLIDECLKTAHEIAAHSRTAVLQARSAIEVGQGVPLADALVLERNMFQVAFNTEERVAGIKAFLERLKAG